MWLPKEVKADVPNQQPHSRLFLLDPKSNQRAYLRLEGVKRWSTVEER